MGEIFDQEKDFSTLVSNGRFDIKGRIADKRTTGRWKVAPLIIVNEVAERLGFYSIAVNMVRYLTLVMHQSTPEAANNVTNWGGASYVLSLLGAFLADSYLGRYRTIVIFSFVYGTGMVLLTLSASIDSLHPPPGEGASTGQGAFLGCALGLIALGTGGIKPCVSSFGADQFDEGDEKEAHAKYAFFNWFFFAINMGVLAGIAFMPYLQQEKGWGLGFSVPTAAVFFSILVLIVGTRYYRFQRPTGSAFTRFLQVLVASIRNHIRGVQLGRDYQLFEVSTKESDIVGAGKLPHTPHYRFLDKAAVITESEGVTKNRWRLTTVTQVEEFKSFLKVLPVWVTTLPLAISFAQLSTFFVAQATKMNKSLGPSFSVPPSSFSAFSALNGLILVPIYELVTVPLLRRFTGHPRGITSLQRIGVGLFVCIFATVSAAVVEKKRREHSDPASVSAFWLVPQAFLIGSAEVFTYVGQLELFYDEATDGTKSISSAVFLTEFGTGSWLSTAIVRIIIATTGGKEKGWLRNDLDQSRLEYFYWILTGLNILGFLLYLWVAHRFKGRAG